MNLPPVYEPEKVEHKIYDFWLDGGYFTAPGKKGEKAFSIVIPPPNVTGTLHMGHALNNTIQDVIIRWKRMQGYDTLWLPGTDHAGIATQNKVEEHLDSEGLSRHDIGREEFLKRSWEWKEEYHKRILGQLYRLGVSCDWSRERFTLDEGCSRAVREVFVSLYEKGLIYRGDYMVNWCPRCDTAISDIEVEHEEKASSISHVQYRGVDWDGYITVATTRPETMLGDTAVAVHPEDQRYGNLVGKKVMLPLVDREIPIIADEYVDPSFGSGAVKITPAHDPNDFEMGLRHNLQVVKAIDGKGVITDEMGKYAGMDRFEAREQIVEDLQELSFLEKVEEYTHSVGHCQRCREEIEPLISLQWFVNMKPLAEPAIKVVKEEKIDFIPQRFIRLYLNWMENIRDWCISRQIWWGHRIPAWYCSCGEITVSREDPVKCSFCGSSEITQDTDVLDTWFSSALWPFSTLGWPDNTADLDHYFPTSVLVTGYDIITFWVSRMIFMSLEFMQEIPFQEVCVHGLVRDEKGRKMSKSLGIGVDPEEVIKKFGADTLRFTLITGQAPGNDQRFRHENVEASRNFANKIWNASRFLIMNLGEYQPGEIPDKLNLHDRWILDRYSHAVDKTTSLLEKYELGEAARTVYDFIWSDFCDWYIELSKTPLYEGVEEEQYRVKAVLYNVLNGILRLLHPFMPFISEEIWHYLPLKEEKEALIVSPWPEPLENLKDEQANSQMELVMEVIRSIRNLRAELGLSPAEKVNAIIRLSQEHMDLFLQEKDYIQHLSSLENLTLLELSEQKPSQALSELVEDIEVYMPLQGIKDINQEIERLEKDLTEVEEDIKKTDAKLSNTNFLNRAPLEVVEKEKNKKEDFEARRKKLLARLEELGGSRHN